MLSVLLYFRYHRFSLLRVSSPPLPLGNTPHRNMSFPLKLLGAPKKNSIWVILLLL